MSKQRESSMVADRRFADRPIGFDRQGIEHGSSIERQVTSAFELTPVYPQGSLICSTTVSGGDYDIDVFSPADPISGSGIWIGVNSKFDANWPVAFAGSRSGISIGSREKPSLSQSFQEHSFSIGRLISRKLASRLKELSSLEDGWDGESAKAVRSDVLLSTVTLLWRLQKASSGFRLPFIAPTHDGYLLLDWTSPDRTLEAEAGPSGWSLVGTVTTSGRPNEYFSASAGSDWDGVHAYYLWFCGETQVWPTE
jgi:hypothetical protein